MSKNVDNEFKIPMLSEGDKIYHYTSAAGLQGILGKEFWITESHFLNDSSEFQIGTEIFVEMIKKHISDLTFIQRVVRDLETEMNDYGRMPKIGETLAFSGAYVISFCMDEDSILMWSEYSNFMGYCMEFDFDQLLNSFEKVDFHGAVIYNHQEQMECMESIFEEEFFGKILNDVTGWEDLAKMSDSEYKTFIMHSAVICILYNMFFKKDCFAGEHEYRFIFESIHDGGRIKEEKREKVFFRIKDEVYIPYIKRGVNSLEGLKSVTVGPKNKSDIAVKGLEYFLRSEKLDVIVKKSRMPLRY